MKTIIPIIVIAIMLGTVGMVLFYQYQVRPLKIQIGCSDQARRLEREAFNIEYPACYYEHFYAECLKEKGLK